MAVKDVIQSRARKKFEEDMLKKYELEAARELIAPFISELKGEQGPPGKDGIDGKDGRDGKDADSVLLQQILIRLQALEQEEAEDESEEDDSEEEGMRFGSDEPVEKKPKKYKFEIKRDRNNLIKDITATEIED